MQTGYRSIVLKVETVVFFETWICIQRQRLVGRTQKVSSTYHHATMWAGVARNDPNFLLGRGALRARDARHLGVRGRLIR